MSNIKKILVISLSNIGDVVMTFPVIDILKRDFPDALLDIVVGPKSESLVQGNPAFRRVYVYHKNQTLFALSAWIREMFDEQYDLAVDLRNTAIPFLIFAKKKTPIMFRRPQGFHMRQQHLSRLSAVHSFDSTLAPKIALFVSPTEVPAGAFAVFAPGSRAENKRWSSEGFAQLADFLIERFGLKIVFVGDLYDAPITKKISSLMKHEPVDLTGKLTLPQVGFLLSEAKAAIVNDSAVSHLASYLNIAVAAMFGPTDPKKYGPWSERNIVIRHHELCQACKGDDSKPHDCILAISFEQVKHTLEPWLEKILLKV